VFCEVGDSLGNLVHSDVAVLTIDSCLPPEADFTWDWNHLELCFTNTSKRAETVIWIFGDGTTNDDKVDSICHTYPEKQAYLVRLYAYNQYDEDVVTKIIDLLSVGENVLGDTKVYPNPTESMVYLASQNPLRQIVIRDMPGREVLTVSASGNRSAIQVSHLPSGVYSLQWMDERGSYVQKLIVC